MLPKAGSAGTAAELASVRPWHCFGGLVAFEMARRLKQSGDTVDFV